MNWNYIIVLNIYQTKAKNKHIYDNNDFFAFVFSTFSTTLSKLFENLSFLDNSLNSKIWSSIATNKSPLKAFIIRHSVLDGKLFNSLLIYGW